MKYSSHMIGLSFLMIPSISYAGFDWGGNGGSCSGSGDFKQQILNSAIVSVGDIPSGKKGVYIKLTSTKDVDVQLYDKSTGEKIVHWPDGILQGAGKQNTNYKGVSIEWSGYNGDGTGKGHEYIKISGTTNRTLVMKAYGYQAGFANIDYSWTGTQGCTEGGGTAESGSGTFQQQILNNAIVTVGDIPIGINNLSIQLNSSKDVDIQLYDKDDDTKIIVWPDGILNGAGKQKTDYKGMSLEWSGYNGDGTGKGHEYINISGKTKRNLTMKAYGYQAGYATVNYSWGVTKPISCNNKNYAYKKALKAPPITTCIAASYDPDKAVEYARKYYDLPYGGAYGNKFDNFDGTNIVGGNCTNFANQSILAGISGLTDNSSVFNTLKTYIDPGYIDNGIEYNAWYYESINNRAPTWTGADAFYKYVKAQAFHPEYAGWNFTDITHDTNSAFMDYNKVKKGDIIFADWPKSKVFENGKWVLKIDPDNGTTDGSIDHTMIVTNFIDQLNEGLGYNKIKVTYQSSNQLDSGLGDINETYNHKALFYVYRPTSFSTQ